MDLSTGRIIDFDQIYYSLIKPAISDTQYDVFRLDELSVAGITGKNMIQSVISSDIMIADLTTQNPNVFYELGIRHMAQRGLTIMICISGMIIPFDIASFKVISYELDEVGNVAEESKLSFSKLLRYSIESNLEQTATDSPIYQLFPDIKLILPDEISISENKRQISNKSYRKIGAYANASSTGQSIENLKEIESNALINPEDIDPVEVITLLKNYRNISAWQDLVNLVNTIPDSLKKAPEVQQLYALSLNRLGEQEKAITVTEDLIAQTGGDAETYGILGRIYKDRYENNKQSKNEELAIDSLDKAIYNYKVGFEKQPNDYYTGINVVNLLTQRQNDESRKEIEVILPKVREALENKMKEGVPDYWDYATALELSCIAKDWSLAEKQAYMVLQQSSSGWMLETIIHNLNLLKPVMNESEQLSLNNVISLLAIFNDNSQSKEGLSNA